VGRDGEIVFQKGYGLADVENGVAARPETVYRIGSITKQFTSAAVMQMVERGEIDLEDPLTRWLPDYPLQGHDVRVRHLLNHTSGIKSYTGLGEAFWERVSLDLTDEELIALFQDEPFDFAPGEGYLYNNSGYYLLGVIVGTESGTPYARYVEGALFEPLGLDDTLYCDNERIVPFRAEGYAYSEAGALENAAPISMNQPGAAGALCSDVDDLIRWTEALHAGEVVSPESLERMTTPTELASGETEAYGFGLGLGELEGHRKVAHGGGINGFSTYLSHYPDDGLTVAVLTNAGSGQPGPMEEALARTALGLELPEPVADLELTPEELARFIGTFDLEGPGGNTLRIRFFAEEGRLKAQAEGQQVTDLRYQGDGVFVPGFDDSVRFEFEGGADRAETVTLYQGGGEFRGGRVGGDE